MEIVNDAVVLVKTKQPHLITERIKKSKVLRERDGLFEVAIHWGLREAQELAAIGLKTSPSPILRDYTWTGKFSPFAHQKETAGFLTLRKKAFCFNEQGCVDADTEYLSPTGWVRIADYAGGKVAQYIPETGSVEFVEPKEYVKLPCADMIRIKTKYGLDQMLSPEHRVLLVNGKSTTAKREVVQAHELLRRHDAYHKGARTATGGTKLGTSTIAFSAAAIPTAFTAAGGPGVPLSDAQLRVQVAVMADGYFGSTTNRCVVRLKRQRKVARLRLLLRKANIVFTESTPEYETAKGFHVFTFPAPRREKSYGASWWDASAKQLKIIADEVLHWDGSIVRGQRFSTTDEPTANFIQYTFCASGRTARVTPRFRVNKGHTEYTVQIRDTPRLYISGSKATVATAPSSDGYKYCFMVPSTFLVFRRNGCVFASGNTGKTASVIWAVDYLMKINAIKRVLVICPLSIMKSAWQQDLFKFAMHRSCSVAHGDATARRKILNAKSEFVIINFDGVAVIKDEIIKGGFDMVVVDEASAYKNVKTNRWKVLNEIMRDVEWLWMLTGTPAAQSPLDAYGLAKLVNPAGAPKYFGQFRDMVMYKVTEFLWKPRNTADKIVHTMLQPAIRFEKDQCLDLPPLTFVERDAPLTSMQQTYYTKLKNQMTCEAAGEQITSVNAATNLNKLLQISGGAVYSDTGEVVEFDVSNRLNVVLEVIEESSHKVLVFVPFTHTINLLSEFLTKHKITNDVISGSVSVNNRARIIQNFQEKPDPHVLVIQPQAASHGLTLTAANTIIWYAPVTSVETYLQANARINRPGQHNPMTIVHIQGSPVEAKLYTMLQQNINSHTKIIDLYRQEVDTK